MLSLLWIGNGFLAAKACSEKEGKEITSAFWILVSVLVPYIWGFGLRTRVWQFLTYLSLLLSRILPRWGDPRHLGPVCRHHRKPGTWASSLHWAVLAPTGLFASTLDLGYSVDRKSNYQIWQWKRLYLNSFWCPEWIPPSCQWLFWDDKVWVRLAEKVSVCKFESF